MAIRYSALWGKWREGKRGMEGRVGRREGRREYGVTRVTRELFHRRHGKIET